MKAQSALKMLTDADMHSVELSCFGLVCRVCKTIVELTCGTTLCMYMYLLLRPLIHTLERPSCKMARPWSSLISVSDWGREQLSSSLLKSRFSRIMQVTTPVAS